MGHTFQIRLPDHIEEVVRTHMTATGVTSADEALVQIITNLLGGLRPPTLPDDPAEAERELLKGMEGEGRRLTPAEQEAMKNASVARWRRSKAG